MKKKQIAKLLSAFIILGTISSGVIAPAATVHAKEITPKEFNINSIKIEKLKNLEKKYGGKISYDSIDDVGNIEEIENKIIEVNKALDEIKSSQQEETIYVNKYLRSSQTFSGIANVSGLVPMLGPCNIRIPYTYRVVTAGGAPYFSSASAEESWLHGFHLGSWNYMRSWTEIHSDRGRRNNVLDVLTKGNVTYSISGVNYSTDPITFKKQFRL
ncbi:hypothetical protein [Clostridium perfringens]|uniref:hypothetical protein n=1 Tax=Clostridium perfringens TaxID=1502 RepID=UPI0028637EF0|nr:hypothetical protein [Clostridium perfringens]MDK0651639.1 hypothetical protein [Clostridium perfringens]MDK0690071.1 hypothetical protein [Clostridium perfringens]MDM0746517.1 hypothetical protein [Clostridium perfringens]MDM0749361.1 hypothetical protein [Clostridium perfringens]